MRFKRILLCIISLFIVLSTFLFAISRLPKITGGATYKEQDEKIIINLWHIDTFEGGMGSRADFLLKTAVAFEKKNKNILVLVTSHTIDSAEENFEKNIFPDMISYGNGLNLTKFSAIDTDKEFDKTKLNDKQYALPWARGGYALIFNKNEDACLGEDLTKKDLSVIVSKSNFNQPIVALLKDDYKIKELKVLPPLEAYLEFVNGKTPYFLGTQRDVIRLENRGIEVSLKPISCFNDLFQYISITAKSEERAVFCRRYIDYLLSKDVQTTLNKIGMFSCFYNVEFDNSHLQSMQDVCFFKTVSPLIKRQELENLFETSRRIINGEISLNKNIENILL